MTNVFGKAIVAVATFTLLSGVNIANAASNPSDDNRPGTVMNSDGEAKPSPGADFGSSSSMTSSNANDNSATETTTTKKVVKKSHKKTQPHTTVKHADDIDTIN